MFCEKIDAWLLHAKMMQIPFTCFFIKSMSVCHENALIKDITYESAQNMFYTGMTKKHFNKIVKYMPFL